MQPRISIVIATYNRPTVLRYAISSVLRSDFGDWEMIVVGDGCTDNTEEVVAAFGDARIRFVNLEANSGGQSAPSNEGVRLARGTFVCFRQNESVTRLMSRKARLFPLPSQVGFTRLGSGEGREVTP